MSDRRVYVRLPSGVEVVRYDRAGKWYREFGGRRLQITFAEAVCFAQKRRAEVFAGLPGGKAFDAAVRRGS
jgi:hypothetical protein